MKCSQFFSRGCFVAPLILVWLSLCLTGASDECIASVRCQGPPPVPVSVQRAAAVCEDAVELLQHDAEAGNADPAGASSAIPDGGAESVRFLCRRAGAQAAAAISSISSAVRRAASSSLARWEHGSAASEPDTPLVHLRLPEGPQSESNWPDSVAWQALTATNVAQHPAVLRRLPFASGAQPTSERLISPSSLQSLLSLLANVSASPHASDSVASDDGSGLLEGDLENIVAAETVLTEAGGRMGSGSSLEAQAVRAAAAAALEVAEGIPLPGLAVSAVFNPALAANDCAQARAEGATASLGQARALLRSLPARRAGRGSAAIAALSSAAAGLHTHVLLLPLSGAIRIASSRHAASASPAAPLLMRLYHASDRSNLSRVDAAAEALLARCYGAAEGPSSTADAAAINGTAAPPAASSVPLPLLPWSGVGGHSRLGWNGMAMLRHEVPPAVAACLRAAAANFSAPVADASASTVAAGSPSVAAATAALGESGFASAAARDLHVSSASCSLVSRVLQSAGCPYGASVPAALDALGAGAAGRSWPFSAVTLAAGQALLAPVSMLAGASVTADESWRVNGGGDGDQANGRAVWLELRLAAPLLPSELLQVNSSSAASATPSLPSTLVVRSQPRLPARMQEQLAALAAASLDANANANVDAYSAQSRQAQSIVRSWLASPPRATLRQVLEQGSCAWAQRANFPAALASSSSAASDASSAAPGRVLASSDSGSGGAAAGALSASDATAAAARRRLALAAAAARAGAIGRRLAQTSSASGSAAAAADAPSAALLRGLAEGRSLADASLYSDGSGAWVSADGVPTLFLSEESLTASDLALAHGILAGSASAASAAAAGSSSGGAGPAVASQLRTSVGIVWRTSNLQLGQQQQQSPSSSSSPFSSDVFSVFDSDGSAAPNPWAVVSAQHAALRGAMLTWETTALLGRQPAGAGTAGVDSAVDDSAAAAALRSPPAGYIVLAAVRGQPDGFGADTSDSNDDGNGRDAWSTDGWAADSDAAAALDAANADATSVAALAHEMARLRLNPYRIDAILAAGEEAAAAAARSLRGANGGSAADSSVASVPRSRLLFHSSTGAADAAVAGGAAPAASADADADAGESGIAAALSWLGLSASSTPSKKAKGGGKDKAEAAPKRADSSAASDALRGPHSSRPDTITITITRLFAAEAAVGAAASASPNGNGAASDLAAVGRALVASGGSAGSSSSRISSANSLGIPSADGSAAPASSPDDPHVWSFIDEMRRYVDAAVRANRTAGIAARLRVSEAGARLFASFLADARAFGFDAALSSLALHRELLSLAAGMRGAGRTMPHASFAAAAADARAARSSASTGSAAALMLPELAPAVPAAAAFYRAALCALSSPTPSLLSAAASAASSGSGFADGALSATLSSRMGRMGWFASALRIAAAAEEAGSGSSGAPGTSATAADAVPSRCAIELAAAGVAAVFVPHRRPHSGSGSSHGTHAAAAGAGVAASLPPLIKRLAAAGLVTVHDHETRSGNDRSSAGYNGGSSSDGSGSGSGSSSGSSGSGHSNGCPMPLQMVQRRAAVHLARFSSPAAAASSAGSTPAASSAAGISIAAFPVQCLSLMHVLASLPHPFGAAALGQIASPAARVAFSVAAVAAAAATTSPTSAASAGAAADNGAASSASAAAAIGASLAPFSASLEGAWSGAASVDLPPSTAPPIIAAPPSASRVQGGSSLRIEWECGVTALGDAGEDAGDSAKSSGGGSSSSSTVAALRALRASGRDANARRLGLDAGAGASVGARAAFASDASPAVLGFAIARAQLPHTEAKATTADASSTSSASDASSISGALADAVDVSVLESGTGSSLLWTDVTVVPAAVASAAGTARGMCAALLVGVPTNRTFSFRVAAVAGSGVGIWSPASAPLVIPALSRAVTTVRIINSNGDSSADSNAGGDSGAGSAASGGGGTEGYAAMAYISPGGLVKTMRTDAAAAALSNDTVLAAAAIAAFGARSRNATAGASNASALALVDDIALEAATVALSVPAYLSGQSAFRWDTHLETVAPTSAGAGAAAIAVDATARAAGALGDIVSFHGALAAVYATLSRSGRAAVPMLALHVLPEPPALLLPGSSSAAAATASSANGTGDSVAAAAGDSSSSDAFASDAKPALTGRAALLAAAAARRAQAQKALEADAAKAAAAEATAAALSGSSAGSSAAASGQAAAAGGASTSNSASAQIVRCRLFALPSQAGASSSRRCILRPMTVSLTPAAVVAAAAAREHREAALANNSTNSTVDAGQALPPSLPTHALLRRLPSVASAVHGLLERSGSGDDLVLATVPWLAAALPDSGHVPERQSAFAVQPQQQQTASAGGSAPSSPSAGGSASVGGRRLGTAYEYAYDRDHTAADASSDGKGIGNGNGRAGSSGGGRPGAAGLHLLREHVHAQSHTSSVRTAARVLRASHLLPATQAVVQAGRSRARALARSRSQAQARALAARRRLSSGDGDGNAAAAAEEAEGDAADAAALAAAAVPVPRGSRPRAAHKRLLSLLAEPFPVFAGEALRFWLDAFNSTDRLTASAAGCALPQSAADVAGSGGSSSSGSDTADAGGAVGGGRFRFRFATSLDRFTLAGIGGLASFRQGRAQRAAWAADARMAPSLAALTSSTSSGGSSGSSIVNASAFIGGVPAACVPAGASTADFAATSKAAWLHPHDLMVARGYAPLAAAALACGRRCVADFALATAAAMEQMHEAQAQALVLAGALSGGESDADAEADEALAASAASPAGRRALSSASSSEPGLRAPRRSSSSSSSPDVAGPDDALQSQEASSAGRRSVRDVGTAAHWHDDANDDAGANGVPVVRIQLSLARSTMRVHWGDRSNSRHSSGGSSIDDDAAASAASGSGGRRLVSQSRDWPVWVSAWSVSEYAALSGLESRARRMASRRLAAGSRADHHDDDDTGGDNGSSDGYDDDDGAAEGQWDVDTRLVIASDPLQGACHGAPTGSSTGSSAGSPPASTSSSAASAGGAAAASGSSAGAGTLCAPSNSLRFAGAVVLFERGGIPLVEKVQRAADAGAVAVVIVDDAAGRCSMAGASGTGKGTRPLFTDRCAPGCSQQRGEGWGCRDAAWLWDTADIPAVMVTREHGQRLIAGIGK